MDKRQTEYGCGSVALGGIVIFVLVGVYFSFAPDTPAPSTEPRETTARRALPTTVANCNHGTPITGQFFVQGREIAFHTGPGENYDLVINRKATEVLGRTEFRTLWPSMVLEASCETGEWLQVRIVEADGSPVNWEAGWVQKVFVKGSPSAAQEAGLIWDIDGESRLTAEEKALVKQGALRVLKDESNCKNIITGYRSGSKAGAFYVTCNAKNGGPPFNVWFTPGQVEAGGDLRVPEGYPEVDSRRLCESAIKARVAHPSTLDFHRVLGYTTEVHNNGNRTISQDFNVKNTFGLETRHRARCLIEPNGEVEVSIVEIQ